MPDSADDMHSEPISKVDNQRPLLANIDTSRKEVVAQLVLASVFKTGEPCVKHAVGGFDSHALPPFFF